MSQATAPITSQRAVRLPARRPTNATSRPPRLRVVSGAEVRRSHTGFGVLCALVMTVGLLAVLLLNTARAEQSFAIGKLQQTSDRLADNQEQLRTDLAHVQAPQQLALEAQKLGMVPAAEVAYVRTSDGKVLGAAKTAEGATPFTVDTLPKTPATTMAGQAVAAADLSVLVVQPTPPTTQQDKPAAQPKSTPSSATQPKGQAATPQGTQPTSTR